MTEPVLQISLDDSDVDINYVSDSNPSSKSNPTICTRWKSDEQADNVCNYFKHTLPPCDEDSNHSNDYIPDVGSCL